MTVGRRTGRVHLWHVFSGRVGDAEFELWLDGDHLVDEATGTAWDAATGRGVDGPLANDGFQDWHTEYGLSAFDLDYRVHHRGSKPMAVAHNAVNRSKEYTQRWMAETSYSTTKRT